MLLGHTWMCPGELSQGRARLCAPCGGAQKAPNAAPHTLEMSHGMCQDKDTVVGWHQGRFTGDRRLVLYWFDGGSCSLWERKGNSGTVHSTAPLSAGSVPHHVQTGS